MRELPSGTVTFLFTDIEGSTRLLDELGDRYADVLVEHRRALREAFAAHGGVEVDTQGDAFFVAFARASDAVAAAREARERLAAGPVRVRMGLHTGEPAVTGEGYVGLDVHRAARIAACGHGGQILLSEQTRALLPEGLDLQDLGLHRLKDLHAAERIFQLGAEEFPPLRSLDQTNLPVQLTPFVGRGRELGEVLELVRREDVRLVTLTGPGGSGKTRLALQAAAELVDEHPDGVWFVGLASLKEPGLLLASVAQALGLREAGGAPLDEALAGHLRGKRALVVLDNLEQLLPEAAGPIGELAVSCPELELLATSREPLHLSGEHEYPVRPLPDDEALVLFAERAQASRPDFELRDENRSAVDAICARLDRLPLAIELAAARIKLLAPAALLARLDRRLPLLVGGARDAPERQRTLRATIEWSFDLLGEDERRLFARLAVFRGGWTLEAAEEVCEAELDTLASLIDKSLVRTEGEEPRYAMLETIREYALEQLEGRPEADELRRAHARHFLALAEEAEPELWGRAQGRWLARLEADHDNLRGALQWSLERGEPELALRLSSALWFFWYMRGHVSEGRRWLARTLEAAGPGATAARAKALDGAGYMAGEQGAHREGQELLRASLRCAREAGSQRAAAIAATHLSVSLMEEDVAGARALGEEAVALARETGERHVLAVALNNLGELARELGDNALATALYEESYVLRREEGDASRIALSLINLGEMALLAGDAERARAALSEARSVASGLGDKRHVCFSVADLGWVALAQGRVEEAGGLLRESLAMSRELGHRRLSVDNLHGLAGVAAAEGEDARAARLAAAAETIEALQGRSPTLADLGIHRGHLSAARERCGEAAWEAAWKEGVSMSLDEAIEHALGEA